MHFCLLLFIVTGLQCEQESHNFDEIPPNEFVSIGSKINHTAPNAEIGYCLAQPPPREQFYLVESSLPLSPSGKFENLEVFFTYDSTVTSQPLISKSGPSSTAFNISDCIFVGIFDPDPTATIFKPFIKVTGQALTLTDLTFEDIYVGDCSVVEWQASSVDELILKRVNFRNITLMQAKVTYQYNTSNIQSILREKCGALFVDLSLSSGAKVQINNTLFADIKVDYQSALETEVSDAQTYPSTPPAPTEAKEVKGLFNETIMAPLIINLPNTPEPGASPGYPTGGKVDIKHGRFVVTSGSHTGGMHIQGDLGNISLMRTLFSQTDCQNRL
ncbi:MAG: hypothetical protein EZS28_040157, partial [Streblomastix strix]